MKSMNKEVQKYLNSLSVEIKDTISGKDVTLKGLIQNYLGEKPSCLNCDVDLLDVIVSLGIGWMLDDWFGLWGDD